MTGTLTLTLDPSNVPPRVRIDIAGAAGATAAITRQSSDGYRAQVRAADPATLVSGAATVYDYESNFNLGATYTYVTNTGETRTASVGQLRGFFVQDPWLIHPGVPALSLKLSGVTLGDKVTPLVQGVHQVLGRQYPITVTDGVRRAPSPDLTCKTFDTAGEAAMIALLADGSPLLLQIIYPFTFRFEYAWVAIGDVTCHEQTDDWDEHYLLWTLPLTYVDRPAGMLQSQWTYSDVLGSYATYNQVFASFATYNDLLTNNPH